MVCRNICENMHSKIIVGQSHYLDGKKYCRKYEHYFITDRSLLLMLWIAAKDYSNDKCTLREKLDTVEQAAGRNNLPGSGSRI
jgi:hypothetical protein